MVRVLLCGGVAKAAESAAKDRIWMSFILSYVMRGGKIGVLGRLMF